MTEELDLFRAVAAVLIEQHGWDRAVFVATAVRGFVYGRPDPGPYRDEAETLYGRLGWEQSALLASWFRDSRNWPARPPLTSGRHTAAGQPPRENIL